MNLIHRAQSSNFHYQDSPLPKGWISYVLEKLLPIVSNWFLNVTPLSWDFALHRNMNDGALQILPYNGGSRRWKGWIMVAMHTWPSFTILFTVKHLLITIPKITRVLWVISYGTGFWMKMKALVGQTCHLLMIQPYSIHKVFHKSLEQLGRGCLRGHYWGVIVNWFLLWEGMSVFFRSVAPGRLSMPQKIFNIQAHMD